MGTYIYCIQVFGTFSAFCVEEMVYCGSVEKRAACMSTTVTKQPVVRDCRSTFVFNCVGTHSLTHEYMMSSYLLSSLLPYTVDAHTPTQCTTEGD